MREQLKAWASDNIVWAGNEHTNSSDRRGYVPEIIVDHITEGTASSCISWFTSAGNDKSSAHFLVGRDGRVYQFVVIENNAWGNGLALDSIPNAKSSVVKSKPSANPNWYSVSIEHEGIHEQTHGELTQAQLNSTTLLHAYIIDYVKDKWGVTIPADRNHILGHFEVDPVRKPFCPGEKFQFDAIIQKLTGVKPNLPFVDIENHWAKNQILEALELGLMVGNGTAVYQPDKPVTRAELACVALKLYKLLK
jgi:N-acetyl-anhydromuramyl-L-alanine amidase AmpD